MSEVKPYDGAERAACEDLALAAGTEFAAIHRFIPEAQEPRLLAFEALFRSLRDIPLTVSDPSVGIAKLGWWHTELAEAPGRGSQHPVVSSLVQTGALATLATDTLQAYLHALMLSLQDESVSDSAALEELLRQQAGLEARLLTRAAADEAGVRAFEGAAAAARLLELTRTLSRTGVEHGWLPMDLVARHCVSRGDQGSEEQRRALARDLLALASTWRSADPLKVDACRGAGASFIWLRDRLVGRRLAAAQRQPGRFLSAGAAIGFADIWCAWNAGRRLLLGECWAPGQ